MRLAPYMSGRSARLTAGYAALWLLWLADWLWLGPRLPGWSHWIVFSASLPVTIAWMLRVTRTARRDMILVAVVASCSYVFWWQLGVFVADSLVRDVLRAYLAWLGTAGLFLIGLVWVVWGIERGSQHCESLRVNRRLELLDKESLLITSTNADEFDGGEPVWNPVDATAWYYNLSLSDWCHPFFWRRIRRMHDDRGARREGRTRRKLNQSLTALCSYSFAFLLASLVFGYIGGCREIYEMPAGGGQQRTIAQTVRLQKIIKKKFVVNPFSAIRFRVPPIDEVKLQLNEVTRHAYTVGYGQGAGAGFAGGTQRGKVRLIRLEYNGGDWDQDFGIGADLNMLIEYGIRTRHKVAESTESRTVAQLKNFPVGKSPPVVYLTGQRNISLSNAEVKILREYLLDKHGMIFGDNGGSSRFHYAFLSMMNRVLPNVRHVAVPLDDVIHRIPYQIPFLPYVAPHGGKQALGWKADGRWVCYYHPGDIGDAWTDDHSGVPPEIWEFCYQLGTNVFFYAHSEYSKWLQAKQLTE